MADTTQRKSVLALAPFDPRHPASYPSMSGIWDKGGALTYDLTCAGSYLPLCTRINEIECIIVKSVCKSVVTHGKRDAVKPKLINLVPSPTGQSHKHENIQWSPLLHPQAGLRDGS